MWVVTRQGDISVQHCDTGGSTCVLFVLKIRIRTMDPGISPESYLQLADLVTERAQERDCLVLPQRRKTTRANWCSERSWTTAESETSDNK